MSASAAQQRQQPAPGMRRIPLTFETYQDRSPPLSSKYLLNLYAEKAPDDARSPVVLKSTPGLSDTGLACGTGPILAINDEMPGALYVVSGTRFYRVSQLVLYGPIVVQDLGDIGAPTAPDYPQNLTPTIAVGVNAVVVCVPPRAYTCGHADTSVNQIGGDFPGAKSVAYLDGYFVFTSDDFDSNFFCSLLLDPSNFDALDFAYADGVPNMLHRVLTLRGELWLCGEQGMEIWYDAGGADFPFRRRAGGVIPFGTSAMRSLEVCDNSMFWLTNLGMVMRSRGYQAERVSTHAIERIIQDRGSPTLRTAFAFTWEGHYCYALSFADRTLVYDCATQKWHERATSADGSGPWLPNATGRLQDQFYFGSRLDGRLYTMMPGSRLENGIDVMRRAVFAPLWADTRRAFCARVEIEAQVGDGLPIDLSWSDDGGWDFGGGPRHLSTGSTRRTRVFTTRLGSFRERVFALTGAGDWRIYAADADIVQGAS